MALLFPSGSRRAPKKVAPPLLPKLFGRLVRNSDGQLTIFFAVTLVMVITVTAFIINVGMYVKAKINLQNAVDAAAWSGAAVQARQLTDIGYLNWEMRNVYKEWLFKYYVLGGISLEQVQNPPGSGSINFRMKQFDAGNPKDPFGFPSVCLDLSDNSNICKIYVVPGLPRFPPTGNIGTDQTSTAFLDAIASKKSQDCSQRSRLNFASLAQWTYSAEGAELSAAPLLVGKRPGAYLKAIEIAMRIRNLERIVNEAPEPQPLSLQNPPMGGIGPHKERVIKSFWAAIRNLGLPDEQNEAPQNFKLTEIPPNISNPINQKNEFSLSYLLIPSNKFNDFQKYYLDLKIYLLNLAPFYTAFVANENKTAGVPLSAECAATKMAMPVPGYPLGFEKNPEIMTYYAVKGEIDFYGLLNPFRDPPKLVAYAAAKPFGGRIGPRLFKTFNNQGGDGVLSVRTVPPRSNQYVIGMKLKTMAVGKPFKPGDAIPFNDADPFWVDDPSGQNQAIGGWTAGDSRFVLPNMIYEYFPGTMPSVSGGNPVQVIESIAANDYKNPEGGLFDAQQFSALKGNLPAVPGGYNSNEILAAIESVRGPTRYDAYNYLVPTDIQKDIDSFQIVSPNVNGAIGSTPPSLHDFSIYAPFYAEGDHFLYNNQAEVTEAVKAFIKANEPAIDKYRKAMKDVSTAILDSGIGTGGGSNIYTEAAQQIYGTTADGKIACQSVAGDFISFYLGGVTNTVGGVPFNVFSSDFPDADRNPLDCPPPLILSFTDYLAKFSKDDQIFYRGQFRYPAYSHGWGGANSPQDYLTAWMPGVRQGANDNNSGRVNNPFSNNPGEVIAKRNFYSTKFIAMDSITSSGHYVNGGFAHYSEGSETKAKAKTEGDDKVLNFIQLESGNINQ